MEDIVNPSVDERLRRVELFLFSQQCEENKKGK